jgi:hypothetical protein
VRRVAIALGLALAAAALYLLLAGGRGGDRGREAGGPPLDQIDDASRASLERVLREADEREAAGAGPARGGRP